MGKEGSAYNMVVRELRDKLNKLIEEGKGDYKVYQTVEEDYELDHIEEGEIWLYDNMYYGETKICITINIKEFYEDKLIKKLDDYIRFW